jgi:large subunit ribosomal protein L23
MDGKLYEVIISPHITEKSVQIPPNSNRVVFRVQPWASKGLIKEAIERLFKVKVERVHVLHVQGKARRAGLRKGKEADWKKAYVTLKQGEQVEVFHGMVGRDARYAS